MRRAIARVKKISTYHKKIYSDKEGTYKYSTQEDMVIACIVENKKIFYQIFSTPPMQSSLIEEIGYNAETEGNKY